MDILSFVDALQTAEDYKGPRHVLLGNGFSMACRSSTFAYKALLEEADFSSLSIGGKELFEAFQTSDFERIIEVLESGKTLLETYSGDAALAARFCADAAAVRVALAEVLARRHPERPTDIQPQEYAAAQKFLSNFATLFTVNYDLLAYWAIMHDPPDDLTLPRNDGFWAPDDEGASYVEWDGNTRTQDVFFLHGGLHLYDAGSSVRKLTYSRTGKRLVEQITGSLDKGMYPLVVTEGSSDQKENKIYHSRYLGEALSTFSRRTGKLFVFGMSFADQDEHILRRIKYGKFQLLFVSLFGDPRSPTNQGIIQRAQALADTRPDGAPKLSVFAFDAASAAPWGH